MCALGHNIDGGTQYIRRFVDSLWVVELAEMDLDEDEYGMIDDIIGSSLDAKLVLVVTNMDRLLVSGFVGEGEYEIQPIFSPRDSSESSDSSNSTDSEVFMLLKAIQFDKSLFFPGKHEPEHKEARRDDLSTGV